MKSKKVIIGIIILLIISTACVRVIYELKKDNTVHSLAETKTQFVYRNYFPSSTTGQIIEHEFFALSYSESHEQAEWVAYELNKDELTGSFKRTDNFRADPMVKTGCSQLSDYKSSGFDRGHLAPAADMKFCKTAMSECFYLSNMSPQNPSFNRGIWRKLEEQTRDWAQQKDTIYVISGPILENDLTSIGPNQVSVPKYYYKIIMDPSPGPTTISFLMPNEKGTKPLLDYTVNIDSVEELTGIDFFPELPDSIERIIEGKIESSPWTL